jgi:hypothetical protein
MLNRDKEILKSLSDLDLSPTMEKNARVLWFSVFVTLQPDFYYGVYITP